jgi:hypothetical protein
VRGVDIGLIDVVEVVGQRELHGGGDDREDLRIGVSGGADGFEVGIADLLAGLDDALGERLCFVGSDVVRWPMRQP